MRDRWPTKDELKTAQERENRRAMEMDDIQDPICECGRPGYACVCEQGKRRDEGEDDGEEMGRHLTTLELSHRLVYLVKLAVERKKQIEEQKALSGKSQDEKPKELLK